jgi:hypothetical protein
LRAIEGGRDVERQGSYVHIDEQGFYVHVQGALVCVAGEGRSVGILCPCVCREAGVLRGFYMHVEGFEL